MHYTDWTRDETLADLLGLPPGEKAFEHVDIAPPALSSAQPPRRKKRAIMSRVADWLVQSCAAYAYAMYPGFDTAVLLDTMPHPYQVAPERQPDSEPGQLTSTRTFSRRTSLRTRLRRWRETRKEARRPSEQWTADDETMLKKLGLHPHEIDRMVSQEQSFR